MPVTFFIQMKYAHILQGPNVQIWHPFVCVCVFIFTVTGTLLAVACTQITDKRDKQPDTKVFANGSCRKQYSLWGFFSPWFDSCTQVTDKKCVRQPCFMSKFKVISLSGVSCHCKWMTWRSLHFLLKLCYSYFVWDRSDLSLDNKMKICYFVWD